MEIFKGEVTYALQVSASSTRLSYDRFKFTKIVGGVVTNIVDLNNSNFAFYFYEAILLRFKHLIDNNLKISDREILKQLDIFRSFIIINEIRLEHLDPYFTNINLKYVRIESISYPIDLTSRSKDKMTLYLNFLHHVFNLDVDARTFITTHFK